MSKVAERIILRRIKDHSERLNTIPDEQFAYRSEHSTELQILRLTEHVTKGFTRKHVTGAVLLDVAKAFDSVWHPGLLIKLLDMGYPISLVKLIKSYLSRRQFRAKIDGVLSDYREIEAGVPQGAVISPHLFTIYTADMPKTARTSMALYADDTAILASSRQSHMVTRYLQAAIDELEEWCNKWKVGLNPEKSKAILFRRATRQTPSGHVTMNGANIQWHDTARYLGVTLDKAMTWKQHIEETAQKGRMVRARLYPMLGSSSRMGLRNKLTLINTVIRPLLMYASTAWGYAAPTHLRKIQAVENIALRSAVGAPWYIRNADLHRDLEHTPITAKIKKHAGKLYAKADAHTNPLIRSSTNYDPRAVRRHKRPRMQLLPDR